LTDHDNDTEVKTECCAGALEVMSTGSAPTELQQPQEVAPRKEGIQRNPGGATLPCQMEGGALPPGCKVHCPVAPGTETKQEVGVLWAEETTSYASNYLFPITVIVWCVMWALVDGGWWLQVGCSSKVGVMMVI
jgi:hypothetical protein